MEVWDPKDKPTVFSQIKKAIETRDRALKVTRYLLYPGILFILVLIAFIVLPGCTWPWQEEKVREVRPLVIPPDGLTDSQNTIACIKLQPECNLDQED